MRIANNTEWLFFHLWKRDPETSLPCQNLNIAETILFRWAQPYFWYSTAKDGTLVRKTKDKVVLSHVEEVFSTNVSKCNVIGTCLNSVEDLNFKTQEKIEFDFVEQSDFHKFLFQKEKPMNLIFQKFIEPKNNKNALIKVSWTPQFCIFFRRTNNNDLSNSKIPLVNRLATFEGVEHLSTSDSVSAPILASELEQTCVNIVRHIQNVTGGNIQISRMVLYFKLDDRNRLWLLFCTGLKFRDKINPLNKGPAKKKNQRPLSPVFTMASKKEEKNTKIVPQEYLLEDQVNEVNTDACLRCNSEGLLYDIKIKLVLGYEERVIKEGGGKKPEEAEMFVSPYKSYDMFDKKHDIGNVPVLMTKLYPNITEERYAKLKMNMSFMNTTVKLCENCYLLVTESLIENNEERKAKSIKRKLNEKSQKNENVFGMQQSFKEPESTISKHKMNQLLPLRSVMEEENLSPVKLYSQSARSPNFVGQLINKTDNKQQENKIKKNPSAFSFQVKAQEPQVILENEEKPNKVVLPQIDTAVNEPISHRVSQGIGVKEHYFRLTKNMSLPEERFKIPGGNIVSPYNQGISITQQNKNSVKKMNISGPIVAFKESKSNKKAVNETVWTPREGIWSQSSKNSARTNFTSMMSTIKDLKVFLGQNLEKKE